MTTIVENEPTTRHAISCAASKVKQPTWLENLGRRALMSRLTQLEHGEITLIEGGSIRTFGHLSAECSLRALIEVHRPSFFRRATFGGDIGAAEAFMDGDWTCDSLTDLIRILIVNAQSQPSRSSWLAKLSEPLRYLGHWFNRNTKSGSR